MLIHLPQKSEHILNRNQMVISFKEKEADMWSLISSYVLRRRIGAKFPKDILKIHALNYNVAETVIFADKRSKHMNAEIQLFVGTNNLSSFNCIWYCLQQKSWRSWKNHATAETMHEQNFEKAYSKRKAEILLLKIIRISLENHLIL